MLSRLPRELLEELVKKRRIYSFVYTQPFVEVWVDGGRLFSLLADFKRPLDSGFFLSSIRGSQWLGVGTDAIHIPCNLLTIALPLRDCDMESFHRVIAAIPIEPDDGSSL